MQSLKRDEATMFSSALRPLRTSCDRHGRLRTPIGAGEACAALDVLRYYANANGISPAAALRRLFQDHEPAAPLDDAAAHALYFAVRRAASDHGSSTSACEQAAVADWTPAIEAAFDKRGQPRIHLPRRTAMSMLARIAREANRACVKWGFDEPAAQADAEFGLLRRACMLLYARTHVMSPIHAMLVIAALKTRSKSALLFASLTPLA
jgi:hypothetical protein